MENSPRLSVVKLLSLWQRLDEPPTVPTHTDPFWASMSVRDRAFAFDLMHGVIRWRGMLDAVISANLSQPIAKLEPLVRAILQVGVYQLLLHGGVADYAAVDSSVELATTGGVPRAGSLVNAVLRAITRLNVRVEKSPLLSADSFPLDLHRRMVFNRAIFPDLRADPLGHLATVTSHPLSLTEMLETALGKKQALAVLIGNNARPVITLRCDSADSLLVKEAGLLKHESPGFFIAAEGWNDHIGELVSSGRFSPQDPTAAQAVQVMAGALASRRSTMPGTLELLDLCAGMGTKTLQMARAIPEARICACDIAVGKLAALERRMKEAGVTTVSSMTAEALSRKAAQSRFDAVLVDVPCSNTGVMARRVQARWRWASLQRDDLASLQHRLLESGGNLVAPGGVLVYSTCSINPGENERIVSRFIASQPQWKLWSIEHQQTIFPRTGSNPAQRCDGGFVCLLSWQRRD